MVNLKLEGNFCDLVPVLFNGLTMITKCERQRQKKKGGLGWLQCLHQVDFWLYTIDIFQYNETMNTLTVSVFTICPLIRRGLLSSFKIDAKVHNTVYIFLPMLGIPKY